MVTIAIVDVSNLRGQPHICWLLMLRRRARRAASSSSWKIFWLMLPLGERGRSRPRLCPSEHTERSRRLYESLAG